MSNEFLDFIEDILDSMGKAEILLENVSFKEFETDFRITKHSSGHSMKHKEEQ
jgi:hypothetical protein